MGTRQKRIGATWEHVQIGACVNADSSDGWGEVGRVVVSKVKTQVGLRVRGLQERQAACRSRARNGPQVETASASYNTLPDGYSTILYYTLRSR